MPDTAASPKNYGNVREHSKEKAEGVFLISLHLQSNTKAKYSMKNVTFYFPEQRRMNVF